MIFFESSDWGQDTIPKTEKCHHLFFLTSCLISSVNNMLSQVPRPFAVDYKSTIAFSPLILLYILYMENNMS